MEKQTAPKVKVGGTVERSGESKDPKEEFG
jgi:hypothetical protein